MRAVAVAVSGALAVAGPAAARPSQPILQSKRLWATVNVCDTVGHPDSFGVRGSMPGTGRRGDEMFMRFRIQFLRPSDGRWRFLVSGGDSGFVDAGSAARARQTGFTFTVTPPPAGRPAHQLRGVVTFEWRRGDTVVLRARRRTSAGHPGTAGADPPSFSAATCAIR